MYWVNLNIHASILFGRVSGDVCKSVTSGFLKHALIQVRFPRNTNKGKWDINRFKLDLNRFK